MDTDLNLFCTLFGILGEDYLILEHSPFVWGLFLILWRN